MHVCANKMFVHGCIGTMSIEVRFGLTLDFIQPSALMVRTLTHANKVSRKLPLQNCFKLNYQGHKHKKCSLFPHISLYLVYLVHCPPLEVTGWFNFKLLLPHSIS